MLKLNAKISIALFSPHTIFFARYHEDEGVEDAEADAEEDDEEGGNADDDGLEEEDEDDDDLLDELMDDM